MEWYLEYEARVLLHTYEKTSDINVFYETAPNDFRWEWLIPIMDGTLVSYIDGLLLEAEKIRDSGTVSADLEPLYAYQTKIYELFEPVNITVGARLTNDELLKPYFDDLTWIFSCIDSLITFASEGFDDPRISDYTNMCYEQGSPLKAAALFTAMR